MTWPQPHLYHHTSWQRCKSPHCTIGRACTWTRTASRASGDMVWRWRSAPRRCRRRLLRPVGASLSRRARPGCPPMRASWLGFRPRKLRTLRSSMPAHGRLSRGARPEQAAVGSAPANLYQQVDMRLGMNGKRRCWQGHATAAGLAKHTGAACQPKGVAGLCSADSDAAAR